ncbi:unnamed protein product [Discosporangium mesarthrocarpum]
MCLSSREAPPTLFHFVLTNSSGVKMHGVTLHVHEEISQEELGSKVSQAFQTASSSSSPCPSSPSDSATAGQAAQSGGKGGGLSVSDLPAWLRVTVSGLPASSGGKPVYSPKALVLLSHYPFYNVYSQFLQQVTDPPC